MKLRYMVGTLCVLGLAACNDNTEEQAPAEAPAAPGDADKPAEAAPPAAETPKAPEVPPKQICDDAVKAAKAKDEGKVSGLVQGDLAADAKTALMAFLAKTQKCGEPKLDGDKGKVPVTVKIAKRTKKKDLPLIKTAEAGWKIDGPVWLEQNPLKKKRVKKAVQQKTTSP